MNAPIRTPLHTMNEDAPYCIHSGECHIDDAHTLVVAVTSGPDLVGCGTLGLEAPKGTVPPVAWLCDLFVHPNHRRKQIATTILKHVEVAAIARGYVGLSFKCRHTNTGALTLYNALGYRVVWQFDEDDDLLLHKRF